MENVIAAIKLIQQLPQGMRKRTIASLYPEYAAQEQHALETMDRLQKRLIGHLRKASLDLALVQLDDDIYKAKQQKEAKLARSRVELFSSVRLLSTREENPIAAFYAVLKQRQFPRFTPFASCFPNTYENGQLKCYKQYERDIRDLSSKWDGYHPYLEEIRKLRQDFAYLDALRLNPAASAGADRLSALQQFHIVHSAPNEYKMSLYKQLLAKSRLTYVQTDYLLAEMCEQLQKSPVIAIDVEFSSYHTYLGNTCLMQVTSVDGDDYVVDLLQLTDLDPLKRILTDPRILKVFHGSSVNDFYWLQRDFRLFVVNIYDTAEVAISLNQRAKLQLLLQQYGVQLNKEQQMSDWAVRPLTEEQISYAREDSHWLIGLAYYQRQLPAVNWESLIARFSDLQLTSARARLLTLEKSILGQIDAAGNEGSFRIALANVFADVWCRFFDLPPDKFKMGADEKASFELIFKEETLARHNCGQFNAAVNLMEPPRKSLRVVRDCNLNDLIRYLGAKSDAVCRHEIRVADFYESCRYQTSLTSLFAAFSEYQNSRKGASLRIK